MTTFANGEGGSSIRTKINAAISAADRMDGYLAVTAAAGSTILTSASAGKVRVTGSTTQTIVLPVASTLYVGWFYLITNDATGDVTVRSSGLNTVTTIPTGATAWVTCILASGTSAASWNAEFSGFGGVTGTGDVVRMTGTYLRLASGTGGIQFGGDTAAANALDDYEEGTFTPVVADASSGGNVATPASALGQYTKIGNLVFIDVQIVDIVTTGMTAGNTLHIRGLPFTSKNTANKLTYFGGAFTSTNSTTGVVFGAAPGNATYMTIREGLTTGSANLTVAALVSGAADIRLSGCYIAA